MAYNATIKQGQSVKIRFKFDEVYSGVVWIGVYKDGDSQSVMMWNTGDRSMDKVNNKEWTKTLTSCMTRNMETGSYHIELLAREADGSWVSIGDGKVQFNVISSNIGKEVDL